MLDSKRFDQLIKEMESVFDAVIIDSPPSLALVDALIVAKRAAGIVLVVRSFVTPKYAGRQVVEQLREAGVKLLGVVLNNVDQPKGGYSYGGAYHYGRYGQYYARYYGGDTDAGAPKSFMGKLAAAFGMKSKAGSKKN